MGGLYTATQNSSGTYSLVSTGAEGTLTEQQQAFYDNLNCVLTDGNTITINAVENSEDVQIGQYKTQTIDVGDMAKFNSIGSGKPTTGSTAEGLLVQGAFGKQFTGFSPVSLPGRCRCRARTGVPRRFAEARKRYQPAAAARAGYLR